MMVSPYKHERRCSGFSSDQMCIATASPFSHWGLIKQLALFIKCMALTTQSHHITALSSHESISKGCYELFVLYEAGSFREVRMERVSSILTSRKASFLFPLMSQLRQFHHLPG